MLIEATFIIILNLSFCVCACFLGQSVLWRKQRGTHSCRPATHQTAACLPTLKAVPYQPSMEAPTPPLNLNPRTHLPKRSSVWSPARSFFSRPSDSLVRTYTIKSSFLHLLFFFCFLLCVRSKL